MASLKTTAVAELYAHKIRMALSILPAGARVCVALSGGVDSVVLLHALSEYRHQHSFHLQACHVHHGLQAEADEWAVFCQQLCATLSVPFQCIHVQVGDTDHGVEAAARSLRLTALATSGAEWLALGHHQNDQAETLLFRLLRGSGVRGLAAMQPVRFLPGGQRLWRPLLNLSRHEILAYAQAQPLTWVEDGSNSDIYYRRNFIRHQVLPLLAERFPAVLGTLSRTAQHMQESQQLLEVLAQQDDLTFSMTSPQQAWSLALLAQQSDARLKNLLRWKSQLLNAAPPTSERLDEAVRQLREHICRAGISLRHVFSTLALCCYRGRVWLEPAVLKATAPRQWHGELQLDWCIGHVEFCRVDGPGLSEAVLQGKSLTVQALGASRWVPQLAGRPHKTFKQLMQEAGIPAWWRAEVPVLCLDQQPVWMGAVGIEQSFSYHSTSEKALLPVWHY